MNSIHATARILRAVDGGEIRRSLPDGLGGFPSEKLVTSLCALAGRLTAADTCYLEVGVFQGLTRLSVAAANPELAWFGIDNSSQLDRGGGNGAIVELRRTALGLTNARAVDVDYEDALARPSGHGCGRKVASASSMGRTTTAAS